MVCKTKKTRFFSIGFGVQAGTWYEIPGKAKSEDFASPSKRLTDLVKMAILAHRVGRGELVWACWQPGLAGVEIGDVRRLNSGAMMIMLTPHASNIISKQIEDAGRRRAGPMQPWHFDLALKSYLCDPEISKEVGACYVYPPVGNYTQHVSGCDPKYAKGAGRPNCWAEAWCCPGTCREDDPQKRDKKFLVWQGDKNHTEAGSANVDFFIVGEVDWRSFWNGQGEHPKYRQKEDRRPKKVLKRPGAKGAADVEPSATSGSPAATGKPGRKGRDTTTTTGVLAAFGGPKGQGKKPPFTLWPDRPGRRQPPLDTDPIEDDPERPKASRRQMRNIRGALLLRSFRNWVDVREEALNIS